MPIDITLLPPPSEASKIFFTWKSPGQAKNSLVVRDGGIGRYFRVSNPEISTPGGLNAINTHNSNVTVVCEGHIYHIKQNKEIINTVHYKLIFRDNGLESLVIGGISMPYLNELKQIFHKDKFIRDPNFASSHFWYEGGTTINLMEIRSKIHVEGTLNFATSSDLYKQGILHVFSYGFPVFALVAGHYYARIAGVWSPIVIPDFGTIGNLHVNGIPGTSEPGSLWCAVCVGTGRRVTYVRGGNQIVRPVYSQCNSCGGAKKVRCNICRGNGFIHETIGTGWFKKKITRPCPVCTSKEVEFP